MVGFRHSRGHFPFGGRRPPEPPPPWPVSPSASSRKPPFVTFYTIGPNLVQLCFCGATSRRFSTISPPIISAIDIPPSFGMLCASLSHGVIYLRVYILLRLSALPSWAVRSTQLHPVTVTRLALPSAITIHPCPRLGWCLEGRKPYQLKMHCPHSLLSGVPAQRPLSCRQLYKTLVFSWLHCSATTTHFTRQLPQPLPRFRFSPYHPPPCPPCPLLLQEMNTTTPAIEPYQQTGKSTPQATKMSEP